MKIRPVCVFAFLFVIIGVKAEPPTLCKANEEVYFSCQAKSKVISVCGSKDATTTDGYLVYRYGEVGRSPELEYPRPGSLPPTKAFTLAEANGAKGGSEQLAFSSGDFMYTLYSDHWATHDPAKDAGLLVEKAGRRVAKISCVTPLAPHGLYNLGKDEFGLKERAKPHFVGLPAGNIRCDVSLCY